MILPVILLLISILLLLAGTRHFFSQHQLTQAAHGADYEKAYHLAAGGLEAVDILLLQAVAFINDGRPESFPRLEKAAQEIKPLVAHLTDSDGFIRVQKGRIQVESTLYKHLQEGFENQSSLKVELELREGGDLFMPAGSSGLAVDTREKKVMVLLYAEASVNGAFARVYRCREAKLVNLLPSVLGKFVLFLRDQDSLSGRQMSDSALAKDQVDDSPLIVYGGQSCQAASLDPGSCSDFFDRQGWFFLGSEVPWKLGSGSGGGDDDFASALLDRDFRMYTIPAADSLSAAGFISYYAQPEHLFKELRDSAYKGVMSRSGVEDLYSSRIRLFGSASRPVPSVTFGKVFNRWVLLQGIKNERTGLYAPFPMLDENSFANDAWPGMTDDGAARIRENFSSDYQRYQARMSSIVEESFNAVNLRALKFYNPKLLWQVTLNPDSLPSAIGLQRASSRATVDGQPADFFKMNYGGVYTITGDDGRSLFSGNPGGIEDLSYLTARVGIRFASAERFYKQTVRDGKDHVIRNVYQIAGELDVDRPLYAAEGCGGMIFVEGDIAIQESISAPAGEPVILVSLGGNISVKTTKPVNAALIALKGSVNIESAAEINGLLAARRLTLTRLPGLKKRSLTYNRNFDVTDAAVYQRAFRLFMPEKGITFVR